MIKHMFKAAKFFIIVGHSSLIIKKEGDNLENKIDYASFIPNIPFYYHFFDEDKNYISDMKSLIKKLKIRNAVIIAPDDAIDLEVDRKVLTEFFLQCGVKKVQIKSQCFLLSLDNKYISISKTTRTLILQYIVNKKTIVKKYYDKNCIDIEQIALDIKSLHADCSYESIPIYINNMNNDMEKFRKIGTLVSFTGIIYYIMNQKMSD